MIHNSLVQTQRKECPFVSWFEFLLQWTVFEFTFVIKAKNIDAFEVPPGLPFSLVLLSNSQGRG